MKRLGFTIIKNTLANVARGGATAMVALVLPHFLTRSLDADRFAAWVLLLQVAAYANYLDFGLQTSLARFLAQAIERENYRQRDALINTALFMLALLGLLALCVVLLVVGALPHMFPSIPASLAHEFAKSVLILGGSSALLLPFSAFSGILVGLHKNEYTALAIGGSRLIGATLVLLTARYTHSLVALTLCVALTNLLGGFLQAGFAWLLLPQPRFHWNLVDRATARELTRFSTGLMAWSFSGMLVTGLDLTILGFYQFGSVGYYAIGSSLVTFVAGLNGSASSALMAPLAALHASADTGRISETTLRVSRMGTYLNLLVTAAAFAGGGYVLRAWVGNAYAIQAKPILEILIIATTIRLVASPYASMLIATGQQRYGIAQGVVEGVTNLVASLLLGYRFGAIGIASGTLIGAVCGILWTCIFTLSWATEFPIPRVSFVREAMIRPLASAAPLLLFAGLFYGRPTTPVSLGALAICCLFTYLSTVYVGEIFPAHSLRLRASNAGIP